MNLLNKNDILYLYNIYITSKYILSSFLLDKIDISKDDDIQFILFARPLYFTSLST